MSPNHPFLRRGEAVRLGGAWDKRSFTCKPALHLGLWRPLPQCPLSPAQHPPASSASQPGERLCWVHTGKDGGWLVPQAEPEVGWPPRSVDGEWWQESLSSALGDALRGGMPFVPASSPGKLCTPGWCTAIMSSPGCSPLELSPQPCANQDPGCSFEAGGHHAQAQLLGTTQLQRSPKAARASPSPPQAIAPSRAAKAAHFASQQLVLCCSAAPVPPSPPSLSSSAAAQICAGLQPPSLLALGLYPSHPPAPCCSLCLSAA